MSTFSVRFKHPDKILSPNAHAPLKPEAAVKLRYKQINVKQQVKTAAMMQVRSYLGVRKFRPASYELVWYYKGISPDADNCLARCKALLDGCAAALGVDDREMDCTGIRRVHTLERGVAGMVDVVFTGEWKGGAL